MQVVAKSVSGWVDKVDTPQTDGAYLYHPQFWDDNFWFSFSVVVSCKSNTQLDYFWWKNGKSSLKTLFTHFVLTLVNLMSRHDTCDFSRFTWQNVDDGRKMHQFHQCSDNKKPSFSRIRQLFGTPEVFLKSVPFLQIHRCHGWTTQIW